jgi:hypothetical protein
MYRDVLSPFVVENRSHLRYTLARLSPVELDENSLDFVLGQIERHPDRPAFGTDWTDILRAAIEFGIVELVNWGAKENTAKIVAAAKPAVPQPKPPVTPTAAGTTFRVPPAGTVTE